MHSRSQTTISIAGAGMATVTASDPLVVCWEAEAAMNATFDKAATTEDITSGQNTQGADERLAILTMLERQRITVEEAAGLLDTLDPSAGIETTLPDATVEEEAWMLTALLQVTEAIATPQTREDNLDDMLARVVRVVPLLAGVDRCTVYLCEPPEALPSVPRAWYPRGDGDRPAVADRDILAQAAATWQPVVTTLDAAAYAVLPMTAQGSLLGMMQVDYNRSAHSFTPKETAILANIACQAAVGVENMRLRQEAVERARLERELQLAHDMQSSLLPATAPALPGWDIAAHWQAARSVGGDFYDFVPLGHDRLGLVIADVSGKGMAAALFMALARSIVRACVSRAGSVARSIERANKLICADARDGTFVTLFYGVLDARTHAFTYTNAGHNPPILASQRRTAALNGRGTALGIVAHPSLHEEQIRVETGDVLVLYTDGLTEAINERQEPFGAERLTQVIERCRLLTASGIIDAVRQEIAAFIGSQEAFDDATIVVARRV